MQETATTVVVNRTTTTTTSTIAASSADTAALDVTNTLPSYDEVVAQYPGDSLICDLEAKVIALGADGSWDLEIGAADLFGDFEVEGITILGPNDGAVVWFPCWGMRLGLEVPVEVDGSQYAAGMVLVVGPETDQAVLGVGLPLDGTAVVVVAQDIVDASPVGVGEDFAVLTGSIEASWQPPAGLDLTAIDEKAFVPPSESSIAPLPYEYAGLAEEAALDLAAETNLVARVTVRNGEWLPETEETLSGRLNFIVEDGIVVDGWIEN
jgi:hypothetical protein